MSKFSDDLYWRGLIKDRTFERLDWLDSPKKFYLGIDASSDGLTIGNLAVIMLARRFIDAGWEAVILAGGATSLVGDPGGKEEERDLKTEDEIANNIKAVKKELQKLFAGKPHEMVNNLDWFGAIKFLDFLREVGKNYSMTELLQRDFVSTRIGEGGAGISYAEFSYSLLQGFDYWWLYKNQRVVLQIGASDQWGNMLSGVPLIRKKEGVEVHAFSMPLVINKQTGKKFGKSEEGAIWLSAEKTSDSDFYQFWFNCTDEEVEDFLKIYTLLERSEIEEVMSRHKNNPSSRVAQDTLATEVTKIVRGENALKDASRIRKALAGDIDDADSLKLASGISVVDALVETRLASSKTDARRVMEEGGVYVNNKQCKAEALNKSDYADGKLILRRGKKLQNTAFIELE